MHNNISISKKDKNKFYSVKEAVDIIKQIDSSKFDETIDISVQLGIDPKKSDEQIKYAIIKTTGIEYIGLFLAFTQTHLVHFLVCFQIH